MDYGAAKRSWGELWTDMIRHPWKTMGFLLLALLASIGSFAAYKYLDIKIPELLNRKEIVEVKMPPKTITYKRLSQEKDADGLWRTLFEIAIVYPAGNTNPRATMMVSGIYPNAECEEGSNRYTVEPYAGAATTTSKFLWSCLSKERILDNGHLFDIIEPTDEKTN